jgi:hypothetical protein
MWSGRGASASIFRVEEEAILDKTGDDTRKEGQANQSGVK